MRAFCIVIYMTSEKMCQAKLFSILDRLFEKKMLIGRVVFEQRIERASGLPIWADLVIYVQGKPLLVIETKKPSLRGARLKKSKTLFQALQYAIHLGSPYFAVTDCKGLMLFERKQEVRPIRYYYKLGKIGMKFQSFLQVTRGLQRRKSIY